MTLAFFGSSLVSAYWNGAATYFRGIIRALHTRGHTITFYEPDALDRQMHRDLAGEPEYARSVVYEPTEAAADRVLAEAAANADVLIKTSAVGVLDAYLERRVLEVRRHGQRVFFWDVDAPATLDRLKIRPGDPFNELVPRYDGILTYGGEPPVVDTYIEQGARTCTPIYNAFDATAHEPCARDKRFAGTLGFLGNRLPDREKRVHEFFFKPAQVLSSHRFLLGGNGWETDDVTSRDNVEVLGHVYTRDHCAFYTSPLAVVNINRESMARYGYSPASRIFEAAGAGACLITDSWAGLEKFLAPGIECLVARNGEDVIHHLQELTPERADLIGQAARRRILRQHTYEDRAAQVQEVLSGQPVHEEAVA